MAGVLSALWFGAAGTAAGFLAGGPVGAVLGAALALALGAPFGWALRAGGSYPATGRGRAAFLVDHTWSLANTLAGALYLVVNMVRRNRIADAYSRGSGCVHLANGFVPGYLTTVGTVIAGVDERAHAHEHGHVLQARIFGPLYLPMVASNYVVAIALPYWLAYHDRHRYPINSLRAYLEQGVYPNTWHEAWCYRVYGPFAQQ